MTTREKTLSALLILLLLVASLVLWLSLGRGDGLGQRAKPFIGNTKPMKDVSSPNIRDVVVWKVTFDRTGNEIGITYKEGANYRLQTGQTINWFMSEAVQGRFPAGISWGRKWEDRPDHQPRETPLSIRHNGKAHLVFVLEDVNWHFTSSHDPFEVHESKVAFYTNPQCAWKRGTTVVFGRQPEAGAECKVATFISNADDDLAQSGDDNRSFVSPFNFYVSIKASGGKRPRYLPLVIDPDVGHPGGNYP